MCTVSLDRSSTTSSFVMPSGMHLRWQNGHQGRQTALRRSRYGDLWTSTVAWSPTARACCSLGQTLWNVWPLSTTAGGGCGGGYKMWKNSQDYVWQQGTDLSHVITPSHLDEALHQRSKRQPSGYSHGIAKPSWAFSLRLRSYTPRNRRYASSEQVNLGFSFTPVVANIILQYRQHPYSRLWHPHVTCHYRDHTFSHVCYATKCN